MRALVSKWNIDNNKRDNNSRIIFKTMAATVSCERE